jgi:hypothetical protein
MDRTTEVASVHFELIQGLILNGTCPTNDELAGKMEISSEKVEELLGLLSEMHGIVLHPYARKPWVVHPFSLTPTLNWVESDQMSWWAPCIWCAFGIAHLVGGNVVIHSRLGAEGETIRIQVRDGYPEEPQPLVVHFAIAPSQAWRNVHEHCSLVLPFHSTSDIRLWCLRHGAPFGEPVPLQRVAALAKAWYSTYADSNWHKWSTEEAQEIFRQVGLQSSFWALPRVSDRF